MDPIVRQNRYPGLKTGNTEGGEQIMNLFSKFAWTNKMSFYKQYFTLLTCKEDYNEMRRQSKSKLRHSNGDAPNWYHW